MPQLPRLTGKEVVKLVEESGFLFRRQTGSHAQYFKNEVRVTIPLHNNEVLHPKIIKQILTAIALTQHAK
jgi:predicted RNA binding protein YcfA (HicA-like mRNA interferase family)